MAITQNQFNNNFLNRYSQVETARAAFNALATVMDRAVQAANPAVSEAASQLDLAGYSAAYKSAFNTARQALIDAATAITAVP